MFLENLILNRNVAVSANVHRDRRPRKRKKEQKRLQQASVSDVAGTVRESVIRSRKL